jgi:transposase
MCTDQTFTTHGEAVVLAVSLELAAAKWKVALHDGRREKPAVHAVAQPQAAARLQAVLDLIEAHKEKWLLPACVRVVVSYEAGQDAFCLSRAAGARHRVLRRRSGEHSGRTPPAAREDRPARCHQAGNQPACVAAR